MMDMGYRKKVLVCNDGYRALGGKVAFCNGVEWDRLGTCIPVDSMSCDFESQDLCGWQSEQWPSVEWKRGNGCVSSEQLDYGPEHDHTVMMTIILQFLIARTR